MAQQRQLLMSLNTRYYTKFAAENPRQIRISANEIKGKTQFLMYYNTLEIVIAVADSLVLPTGAGTPPITTATWRPPSSPKR